MSAADRTSGGPSPPKGALSPVAPTRAPIASALTQVSAETHTASGWNRPWYRSTQSASTRASVVYARIVRPAAPAQKWTASGPTGTRGVASPRSAAATSCFEFMAFFPDPLHSFAP